MKITVLRKMRYEGLFIYIRQYETTFEYLFALHGDIYTNTVDLKPQWNMWLQWWVGRIPIPYTGEELEDGEQLILSGAMETIDRLKGEGKLTRQASNQKDKEFEKVKKDREAKKDMECMWQSRETKGGWYYICLVHGVATKIKDGEKPSHD